MKKRNAKKFKDSLFVIDFPTSEYYIQASDLTDILNIQTFPI